MSAVAASAAGLERRYRRGVRVRVLLGVAGLAVLALVGVLALGRAGLPVPSLPLQVPRWAPACQLFGEGGTVVLDGSVETMTAAVQMALSNDPDAPREAASERVGAQEATAGASGSSRSWLYSIPIPGKEGGRCGQHR